MGSGGSQADEGGSPKPVVPVLGQQQDTKHSSPRKTAQLS